MSSSLQQVASYLGGLTVFLRNLGSAVPECVLDRYDTGEIGFRIEGALPGQQRSKTAIVLATEIWRPAGSGRYNRVEYEYEFIDHPADRRRAFHMHDTEDFLARFGVLVHEHCEEVLGKPRCGHYFGLPVSTGYEALNALLGHWGQPEPLRCARLRCIDQGLGMKVGSGPA